MMTPSEKDPEMMTTRTKEKRIAKREKAIRREFWITFPTETQDREIKDMKARIEAYSRLIFHGTNWTVLVRMSSDEMLLMA